MKWGLFCAVLAACYSPAPHAGARCADGQCPDGLVCSPATDTCEVVAVELDGSIPLSDGDLDGPGNDASMTVSPDARACWGSGLLSICPTNMPVAAWDVTSGTTISTTSSSLCVPYTGTNPGAYCVVVGTSVSIAAGQTLRAFGSKPLVILSTGTLTVDGTIDVSAGAGANPTVCVAGGTPSGAQGGAGGSFTGVGGSGGGIASGLGPAGAAATMIAAVRGGCAGGNGGGTTAGAGGKGGGAVYLIGTSISVSATGSINASGAKGVAATATGGAVNVGAGGGGGGAGGFIGFDAPTVSVLGAAFANGGGGGEGATPNKSGSDGSASTSALTAGSGGSGGVKKGGDGGAGSQGATRTGANGTAGGVCDRGGASGGGGGGAAGMIYVHPAQTLVGQISPPSS